MTWVGALLIAAERRQWIWLVAIALVNYIAALFYIVTIADEPAWA